MIVDGHELTFDVVEACTALDHDAIIAIDTETTGLSPWKDNIATIQLYGVQTGMAAILQIKNGVVPWQVANLLSKGRLVIGHNLVGFDLLMLNEAGVHWQDADYYDTLVGETVIVGTGRRDVSVSLRSSVKRRLGLDIDKNIEHSHWDADTLTPEQVNYAIRDVLSLPALRQSQIEKAEETGQRGALDMEMSLIPAVSMMTINGLPINAATFNAYKVEQTELMRVSEQKLHESLGPINLNSTVQLKRALAAKGFEFANTASETLQDAVLFGGPAGEVAQLIIDYRHPAQRLKMYSDRWVNEFIVNGWVHGRFWQCSADTGRFTSSDPNLQQVPKDGRKIVGCEDMKIVSGDYSQIEVRIAAEVANDLAMIAALAEEDIHTSIASTIFEIPQAEVTKEVRKLAKAIVFTLLFGGGSLGLYQYARRGGSAITLEQATDLRTKFFERFSGINRIINKAQWRASQPGAVIIRLPNGMRRILIGPKKTATVILNTTVQGSAAIGIKYGMLEALKAGLFKYIGAQVHDELVGAVPVDCAEDFAHELERCMVTGMQRVVHNVPVKVETKIGDCWQP